MAEVIVSSLLLRLEDPVVQEAFKLYGVNNKVEIMKEGLIRITCFLKDADSRLKLNDNESIKEWVRKVREVSFMIEDSVNTFLYRVENLSEKDSNFFKKTAKRFAKRNAVDNLDGAINTFQARIEKINETRESVITDLGENSMNNRRIEEYVENDKINVVGFDKERRTIIKLLLDQNTVGRSVVSIVGIGGSGKTTLAKEIYQSVREKFEFHIWLTVSQLFNQRNLLKKVLPKAKAKKLEELVDFAAAAMEEELVDFAAAALEEELVDFAAELVEEFLKGKRYLIILDDVYSSDVWTKMKVALPDDDNMSRVVITTRNGEIAVLADPKNVCELDFLSQEESIKLLFRTVLPHRNFEEDFCPPDLLEAATNFSNKCGGWPLALVEAGDQLPKALDPDAWKMVMKTMDRFECTTEIIATSYENLPVYLKSCFMYFALFPEFHEYDAGFIACLWIAEGFIPHDRSSGLDEVAKKYLDELAQRCMIKVLRSGDGSVLTFRVHKLLHEFAIRKAQETGFVKVLSKKEDCEKTNSINSIRRVTSQLNDSDWEESSSREDKITENINPKISTLLLFGMMLPFSSQFTLLRVLVIFHYNGGLQDKFPSLLVSTLKKLLLLRCLAFIGCNFPSEVVLPINHLQKLITLIIRSCQNIIVPSGLLSDITTLRHVEINDESIIQLEFGGYLPNLQTLKGVTIENPEIGFLYIPNVRELHLSNLYDSWDPIIVLLTNLRQLETLTLEAGKIPIEIIGNGVFLGFNTLRTLYLNGVWQCNVMMVDMFPPFLTSLKLVNSQIDKKLMRGLERLPYLKMLSLFGAYKGSEMITTWRGFCRLQKLEISWMYGLKEWIIEEGAMPELTDLKICYCNKLEMLPDLQYLTALKVLTLRYMNKKFKLRLENEDQRKIENIPFITIKDE